MVNLAFDIIPSGGLNEISIGEIITSPDTNFTVTFDNTTIYLLNETDATPAAPRELTSLQFVIANDALRALLPLDETNLATIASDVYQVILAQSGIDLSSSALSFTALVSHQSELKLDFMYVHARDDEFQSSSFTR
jgi:hypothetical protein